MSALLRMIKMGRSPKIVLHRLASNDWKRACARSTTYLVCVPLRLVYDGRVEGQNRGSDGRRTRPRGCDRARRCSCSKWQ